MANRQGRRNQQTTRITPVKNRSNIHTKTQVLRITLILTVASFLTFLITLLSSQWIIITYPSDFFATRQQMFVVRSTYGIIWECLLGGATQNSMIEKECEYHQHQIYNTSETAEKTRIGMVRTMYAFSIIHILLAIVTLVCGVYSIHDHRYTYKRLTAMIYILTAAALVVCIEVLSTVFRYTNAYLPDIYPAGTKYSYGSCYIIAWVIFFQLLFSSFVFFACSKKRKGTFDEATEEEALANRPVDLTRSFRS